MRTLLLAALLASLALAGCSGKAAQLQGPGGPIGDQAGDLAAGLWNYTTADLGGAPVVRDYAGTLTPQQAANGGVPFGLAVPQFQTCCYFSMVDAPDLLADGQLVSMRVTLTWTNAPGDRAGLDAAICVPWHCIDFNRGDDESLADGAHQDVLTRVTSGRKDFLDQGLSYQVGVRFTNAVLSSGLAYSIHVELFPVGGGLAPGDAYEVQVPEGGNVTGELVAPLGGGDASVGLMLYGPDDRPARWLALSGKDGDTFPIPLPAGRSVLAVLDYDHAFLRLRVNREPPSLALRPLTVEFGQSELVSVPDSQAHEGSVQYAAQPGMMGDFPWFLYADGVAAQNAFGFEPSPMGGANLTFSSSHGLVAGIDLTQLSVREAGGQNCFNCNGQGTWNPGNYLDDDGSYEVKWRSEGGAGTFVMFTQRYVR
jgi:hypothetical protein